MFKFLLIVYVAQASSYSSPALTIPKEFGVEADCTRVSEAINALSDDIRTACVKVTLNGVWGPGQ